MSLPGPESKKHPVHYKNTEFTNAEKKPKKKRETKPKTKPEVISGQASTSEQPQAQLTDIHHKNTEISNIPAKTDEAIDGKLKEVLEITKQQDEVATTINKQGKAIARMHDNVDKTNQNLQAGEKDLGETNSCCLSIWDAFKAALCCCCMPKAAEPHHGIEFNQNNPAPVAFSSTNPAPKSREQKIIQLAEVAKHNRTSAEQEGKALDKEIIELKDIKDSANKSAAKSKLRNGKKK